MSEAVVEDTPVALSNGYAGNGVLEKELNQDPTQQDISPVPAQPESLPPGIQEPRLRMLKKCCGFRAKRLKVWEAFSRPGVMNKWSQSATSEMSLATGIARWYDGQMQGVPVQVVDQAQLVMRNFWLSVEWGPRNLVPLYDSFSDSWVVIELDEYQPGVDGADPVIRVRVWHWGFPNYDTSGADALITLNRHWDKYVFQAISTRLSFPKVDVPWDWW